MNKIQFSEKISEIDNKLNALGDLTARNNELNALLQQFKISSSQIEQGKQGVIQIQDQIKKIYDNILQLKPTIEQVIKRADEYNVLFDGQKKEFGEFKKQFEILNDAIKNQLGVVSTEILANSFKVEADNLGKSVSNWFWWFVGSVNILLLAATLIIIWEINVSNTIFTINFLIKLSLTTPLIYFVVFVSSQYKREKKLFEEYVFKATIARSFEAYRKLIKEEAGQISPNQEKVLGFITGSINNIYSSPMENIQKTHNGETEEEELSFKKMGKFVDIIQKFIK